MAGSGGFLGGCSCSFLWCHFDNWGVKVGWECSLRKDELDDEVDNILGVEMYCGKYVGTGGEGGGNQRKRSRAGKAFVYEGNGLHHNQRWMIWACTHSRFPSFLLSTFLNLLRTSSHQPKAPPKERLRRPLVQELPFGFMQLKQ